MSKAEVKPENLVQNTALMLAERLRTQGGSKDLRRRARTLLKQAYTLEQECGAAEKLNTEQEERARRIASDMDQVFGALTYEDAGDLADAVFARFTTPNVDIGQRIRAERTVLVAIEADRLGARFLSRVHWFWERSERARTGVAGIGSTKESPSPDEKPAERESFELIWRRRRK